MLLDITQNALVNKLNRAKDKRYTFVSESLRRVICLGDFSRYVTDCTVLLLLTLIPIPAKHLSTFLKGSTK
jgi:hypothetical protein